MFGPSRRNSRGKAPSQSEPGLFEEASGLVWLERTLQRERAMTKERTDQLSSTKGFGIYSCFSATPQGGLKLESDGKWFRALDSYSGCRVDEVL